MSSNPTQVGISFSLEAGSDFIELSWGLQPGVQLKQGTVDIKCTAIKHRDFGILRSKESRLIFRCLQPNQTYELFITANLSNNVQPVLFEFTTNTLGGPEEPPPRDRLDPSSEAFVAEPSQSPLPPDLFVDAIPSSRSPPPSSYSGDDRSVHESAPSRPYNLQIKRLTSASVVVTWRVRSSDRSDDLAFACEIAEDDGVVVDSFRSNRQECEFDGLTPNRAYQIRIQAMSPMDVKSKWSHPLEIVTEELPVLGRYGSAPEIGRNRRPDIPRSRSMWDEPVAECQYCSQPQPLKSLDQHEQDCRRRGRGDDRGGNDGFVMEVECVKCRRSYPIGKIDSHERGCRAGPSSLSSDHFESDHLMAIQLSMEASGGSPERTRCRYCNQDPGHVVLQIHEQQCRAMGEFRFQDPEPRYRDHPAPRDSNSRMGRNSDSLYFDDSPSPRGRRSPRPDHFFDDDRRLARDMQRREEVFARDAALAQSVHEEEKLVARDSEVARRIQSEIGAGALWYCSRCRMFNYDELKQCWKCREAKPRERMSPDECLDSDDALAFELVRLIRNAPQTAEHSIVNFDLAYHFGKKFREMYRRLGEDTAKPKIVYHWTREGNFGSIEDMGLVVPDGGRVKHATDVGYYGKGIYTSPDARYAASYGHGATKTFVCLGLTGRQYRASYPASLGKPCEPGFDSHVSDDRNQMEWVFFDSAQLLPCCLIQPENTKGVEQFLLRDVVNCLLKAARRE